MNGDPYTMEMRLCDDGGVISHAKVEDPGTPRTLDKSYLSRFRRLRRMGGMPYWGNEFTCTGSAHVLPGEHIRCTSLAHSQPEHHR